MSVPQLLFFFFYYFILLVNLCVSEMRFMLIV